MKVLAVQSDPAEILRLKGIVEAVGCEYLSASNGDQAYRLAVIEQPDVVMINTVLPDMRGMELFYQIRIHPALCNMVVILANPQPTEEEVLEGFCLHSDFHWQHPIHADDLIQILTEIAGDEPGFPPRFMPAQFLHCYPNEFTRRQGK